MILVNLCKICAHKLKDWEVNLDLDGIEPPVTRTWVICDLDKDEFPWADHCDNYKEKE